MVRPADRADHGDQDGRAAGGAAGVSVLRDADAARGHLHATRCWPAAARWCGRNCWRSSNLQVGDALLIGTQPFEIRGVIATEPGRSLGAFSLGPRVLIDYADLPSTGLLSFGSRANFQLLLKGAGGRPCRELGANLDRRAFANQFVRVARLLAEPGPHRREPDAGRELPEPRRAGDPDSRRHRRVERHAGVRAAEGAQHRHPEVRRRHLEPGAGHLPGAGRAARRWPGACSAWRWRPARDRRGARASSATVAGMLQVDYGLSASAAWQGLAVGLLVSLLFSVVPLLEVRKVKPSLLLRQDVPRSRRHRLAEVGRGGGRRRARSSAWPPGRPARCSVGLLLSGGFVAIARRAARGGHRAGAGRCSRCATRARSRCGRRCCTSCAPATRRASSCSPSASAPSSSSACARCRPTCCATSRCRSATTPRTCS